MLFKKFDKISPSITLFFKRDNSHSSVFSGVLTVIVYIIILISSIYYFSIFFQKKNPTAFFINRYIEDAGIFPLNASSIFHYIKLKNTSNKEIVSIDYNIIRIVGIKSITIDNYYSTDLSNTPHWLYGLCNNDTDINNIKDLINPYIYKYCACIRKYYDPKTKKYYDINDKNFIWPTVEHGMSNNNSSFYGIIVEKCKNDELRILSGLGPCESSEIIDKYIFSKIITLYLIDHISDVLNYNKPFSKYFYSIGNMLYPKYYTVNNINLNPAQIKTHNGIILDNIYEENSYLFSLNEKITLSEEVEIIDKKGNNTYNTEDNKIIYSTGIVSSYYFFMQNRLQYYERDYKRLQDTLSNIGGLSRIVFYTAFVINSFVSNYIILSDMEKLALSLENMNYKKANINTKQFSLIMNPPKIRNFYKKQNNSNLQTFIKKDADTIIYQNNQFKEDKEKPFKYYSMKDNSISKKNNLDEEQNKSINISLPIKKNKIETFLNRIRTSKKKSNYRINQFINEEDKITEKMINKKSNLNLFKYIWFIICCKRNNSIISFYEEYRAKFISEENIIQDSLNINRIVDYFHFGEKKDVNQSSST